jgi:hypothetical protein
MGVMPEDSTTDEKAEMSGGGQDPNITEAADEWRPRVIAAGEKVAARSTETQPAPVVVPRWWAA